MLGLGLYALSSHVCHLLTFANTFFPWRSEYWCFCLNSSRSDITDVAAKTMGPFIPETLAADKELDDFSRDDYVTFILSDSQSLIDRDGTIRAVEGYGIASGDMELQIYRPFCGNESCPHFPPSVHCPTPQILCVKTETCTDPSPSPTSRLNPAGNRFKRKELKDICRPTFLGPQFSEYKLMRRVKLTLTKGYFFIRLSKPRNLSSGDLMALRSRGGQVARRRFNSTTYDHDSPDWKVRDGNPDEPLKILNSGQMIPLDNIKYMMKIITYEDLILKPAHEYVNASTYSVNMKLTSPWAESDITKSATITVAESIDRLRMKVTPPNAAVDAPVSVSVILSSGTGVKLFWDFGDGSTEEALVDVTSRNEKFTRTHNYTEPGNYNIRVVASNIQSTLSSQHLLTAQYPITKQWKLISSSPQLLPGQDHELCSTINDDILSVAASSASRISHLLFSPFSLLLLLLSIPRNCCHLTDDLGFNQRSAFVFSPNYWLISSSYFLSPSFRFSDCRICEFHAVVSGWRSVADERIVGDIFRWWFDGKTRNPTVNESDERWTAWVWTWVPKGWKVQNNVYSFEPCLKIDTEDAILCIETDSRTFTSSQHERQGREWRLRPELWSISNIQTHWIQVKCRGRWCGEICDPTKRTDVQRNDSGSSAVLIARSA